MRNSVFYCQKNENIEYYASKKKKKKQLITKDSNSCEPLMSINDGNAVGGNVENSVDIKLLAVFDICMRKKEENKRKNRQFNHSLPLKRSGF